ncbi:MAG: hypothetical protein HY043_16200 [Verrucomicrobia bacterium]|nr:hypothetical protein [Verrucomicrobiota bacterium]
MFNFLSACLSRFSLTRPGFCLLVCFAASLVPTSAGDFSSAVFALATRTNGSTLVGGAFTNFNGAGSQFVARLNADGSLDSAFAPTPGPNGFVRALAFQADGKILLGGGFATVNGIERFNLARLNADGSLDAQFALINGGVDGTVLALSLSGTNQIYLAGEFTTVGGTRRLRVARVRGDGLLDARFDPLGFGANDTVRALAVQSDGKVLIAGDFTTAALVPRSRMARLQVDGLVDFSFDPGTGADGIVRALAVQSDGKVLLAGDFREIDGYRRVRLARLNADGSLDESFDPGEGAGDSVNALALQADGKILIGGFFTSYDQRRRNFLARLGADGSLDAGFDLAGNANGPINTIVLPAANRLLLGGNFTLLHDEPHAYFAQFTNFGHATTSQIEFAAREYTVSETNNTVVVSLIRTGDAAASASVDYTTSADTATADVDFTSQAGTVIFHAGETNQTISLTIKNDHLFDGAETFYVILSNPVGDVSLGERGAAQVSVTDDESAQAGDVDPGFEASGGADGEIDALAIQPDGKLLLAGNFTRVNLLASPFVARLNTNGSFDTFFDVGVGPDARVRAVTLQNENNLLIGGDFLSVDGFARQRIAQLLPNGQLDLRFDPGAGANDAVLVITTNFDRRILLGGEFTEFNNARRSRVVQLFGDGELDPIFDPAGIGFNHAVRALALTPAGKILAAGDFTYAGNVPRSHLAQLNADGSLDLNFDPGSGTDGIVNALAVQPDGAIVIAGDFQVFNGVRRARLARLNPNGTLDFTFNPGEGPDAAVRCLLLQPNGIHLVGGDFILFNGLVRGRFARLNANGSLDTTFDSGSGADATVNALASGTTQVFVAGNFMHINGFNRDRLGRVFTEGTPAATKVEFTTAKFAAPASNGLAMISVQRTGQLDAPAAVDFMTRDGSAVAGIDYFTQTSTLNFAPNETNKIVSVFLRRDLPGRGNRSVNLLLLPTAGVAVLGTQGTAVLTITDDLPVFAGSVDVGFAPISGPTSQVLVVAALPNGKILAGGSFSNPFPLTGPNLTRLNHDGSLDTSFDPGAGTDGPVRALALSPDGGAFVGGSFTSYAGTPRNFLARVQTDGALAASFDPGTNLDGAVNALAVQTDGRIIIGGEFKNFGGLVRGNIARLNSDASLDLSFNPGAGADDRVHAIALQADEKLIVAGEFTAINNFPRARLARLNRDGSVDTSFNIGEGVDGPVLAVALRTDGAIWIAGEFTRAQNVARKFIARLTANGALDATFDPGASANARILTLAAQPDDKVWIGGDFTNYAGFSRAHVARLLENGSADDCFRSGTGANNSVNSIAVNSTGAIVLGGQFQVVDGFRRPFVARLIGDPPPVAADLSITRPRRLLNGDFQFSVNTQPGRCYIIEAAANLFDWQPLSTNRLSSAVLDFEDVGSANVPLRFYRVRREP